jgi:aspartate 1-decarboxylase
MLVSLLRVKLHHARVTGADLNYVGSITIDAGLLQEAGIYEWEKVLVVDLDNGARFETYAIPGEAGSGTVQLNGAAARLAAVGDRLIVMAFASVEAPPPADWQPRVLVLDAQNAVAAIEAEGHFSGRSAK